MTYITEQEFCDIMKISKARLRNVLREHENPVYYVKRNGAKSFDKKEAFEFRRIYDVEREESKKTRVLKRWMRSGGYGRKKILE